MYMLQQIVCLTREYHVAALLAVTRYILAFWVYIEERFCQESILLCDLRGRLKYMFAPLSEIDRLLIDFDVNAIDVAVTAFADITDRAHLAGLLSDRFAVNVL